MEAVWLDTDIGTDIDDAVCIAQLLGHPGCELVGVSTVGPDAVGRAKLVSAICRHVERDIPVYPGASSPVGPSRYWPDHTLRHLPAIESRPHATDFPAGGAVEAMRRALRERPGEITVLTIGLFTNLGLLCAVDPGAAAMAKRFVSMGGGVDPPRTECNAMLDGWATDMVFRAPGVERLLVPLEITRRIRMPLAPLYERLGADRHAPVKAMVDIWRTAGRRQPPAVEERQITLHDPLAAAVVFEPDICAWEAGVVSVEVQSDRVRGMTFFRKDPEGPDRVAVEVDAGRFRDALFATL